MASYSTNEFKAGLKIILDGDPCNITENILVKPGKGQAFNRVKVKNLKTGRTLECLTTEPAVQLYTTNHMDQPTKGRAGRTYAFRGAFCLETQHYPDSPNHPSFPTTTLKPGETYRHTCVYRAGVVK